MKTLTTLLRDIKAYTIQGSSEVEVWAVTQDSRLAEPNGLYAALPGTRADGRDFIQDAINHGATVVVCESLPAERVPDITYVHVESSSEAFGLIASHWFDDPSAKLKLVGVTGTNGKTTTATLLHSLFVALGYKSGLISTIENKIVDQTLPSTHTTPEPYILNQLLYRMVNEGCTHCFMEVSSHAVVQNRISGLHFAGGIFSNLTHDHLDYHKTFDAYLAAKKRFFDRMPAESFSLVNADDRNGLVMVQNTQSRVRTYSLQTMADYRGSILGLQIDGLHLRIDNHEVWCRLVGRFNAYNLLAVYATAVELGEEPLETLTALSNLRSVEGRFDWVQSDDQIIGIVDYAHSPDALTNVLETINQLRTGQEILITVVGCGGDRDHAKRPVMARIASRLSNQVILTSDNPRTEDPLAILAEMAPGVEKDKERFVQQIPDRHEAIKAACNMARSGDIILVAGKGHEKYQDIAGTKYPFDDKLELSKYLITNHLN